MAELDRQRGDRIRDLRERVSWSQEELAQRVGVSYKTVHNWEAGKEIQPSNLRALAKVFSVSPEFVRYGERETPDLAQIMGSGSQLDRIEVLLGEILTRLDVDAAEEAAQAAEDAVRSTTRKPARSGRKRPSKRRSA